jgi:Transposase zinc-ribbon domain
MNVQLNKFVYVGMSLVKFQKEFGSEPECWDWLFHMRWPEGFRSPRCDHPEYTLIEPRRLYMCKACRHQTHFPPVMIRPE